MLAHGEILPYERGCCLPRLGADGVWVVRVCAGKCGVLRGGDSAVKVSVGFGKVRRST